MAIWKGYTTTPGLPIMLRAVEFPPVLRVSTARVEDCWDELLEVKQNKGAASKIGGSHTQPMKWNAMFAIFRFCLISVDPSNRCNIIRSHQSPRTHVLFILIYVTMFTDLDGLVICRLTWISLQRGIQHSLQIGRLFLQHLPTWSSKKTLSWCSSLPQEDAQIIIVEVGSFGKFLGSTTKAEKLQRLGDDGEKIRKRVLVNSETPMVATVHITRSF